MPRWVAAAAVRYPRSPRAPLINFRRAAHVALAPKRWRARVLVKIFMAQIELGLQGANFSLTYRALMAFSGVRMDLAIGSSATPGWREGRNMRLATMAIAICLCAGAAFAQTAGAPPASSAPAPPSTRKAKPATPPQTPEGIECSKQADAKGLHGQERIRFRANCKKKLKEKS
jgi:hypothetical protein